MMWGGGGNEESKGHNRLIILFAMVEGWWCRSTDVLFSFIEDKMMQPYAA